MFRNRKKRILLAISFIGVSMVVLLFTFWLKGKKQIEGYSDLKALQSSGRIRVGILQNATDYYVDNGHIEGFQFEMVERMAKHLKLTPHYVVYNTYWDNFYALLNNEVDLLAMNLNQTLTEKPFFRYTAPHSFSEHVLVQRKKDLYINEKLKINPDIDSLTSKNIVLGVPIFSAFYHDALNLLHQANDDRLKLKTYSSFDVNAFFTMLDTGNIDLLIVDAQTMKSNSLLYPALDYSVAMTEVLPQSWAVHSGNSSLCHAVDKWMNRFVHTEAYKQLLKKYYSPHSQNRQRIGRQQRMQMLGSISPYDDIIKKQAKKRKLDWRFVAAIIFQESRFDPTARGWGGSYGLMQTMPATAKQLGTEVNFFAEKQIADGCKHIQQLIEKYSENYTKEDDLLKIVLMAYNTGNRNVENARNLATKKGLNPDSWNDIEYVLRNTSKKSFIKDSSNIKGNLALKYVYAVWMRYIHYRNMSNPVNYE